MITVSHISKTPIYKQIYEELKRQILNGELSAGHRLPPTRTLAKDYSISRNTVITAYTQLQSEGFIRSVTGSGYYVEALPEIIAFPVTAISSSSERASDTHSLYDFSYGNIDLNVYRTKAFRKCLNNALAAEERQENLNYSDPPGIPALRQALVRHLHTSRGVNTSPEQVVITGGHHYSLQMITELLPKDRFSVAMEEPGYCGTRDVFTHAGYKLHPIALDENGIQTERLKNISHAILYVTPSHQFPMGCILPVKRRLELLKWAAETDSYIIEDDYDSELRYHELPIPSLQSIDQNNRVIYLGTFSKSLSPDLRASYIILPQNIGFEYKKRYPFFNAPSPAIIQTALAEYIESGEYQKHLNSMRAVFRKKHNLILSFIKNRFPNDVALYGIGGGMHFVLEINTVLSQEEIIAEFAKDNVGVYPTKEFWNDTVLHPENQVVIGYGAIPLNRLSEYLDAMSNSLVRILK